MRTKKQKIIVSCLALFLTGFLIGIGVLQWQGIDVYEPTGAQNGRFIGPLLNDMRRVLGNKVSALISFSLATLPVLIAVKYWQGKIK